MLSPNSSSLYSYGQGEDKLREKFAKKNKEMRAADTILNDKFWTLFVQGYDVLIKYRYKFPDLIAEYAVELTETFKIIYKKCVTEAHIQKYNEIFVSITPHLAQMLSTQSEKFHYRSELLNLWIEIVEKLTNDSKKKTLIEQTESVFVIVLNCIFFTGNFYTQLNALELILKYLTSVNRNAQIAILNDVLAENELKKLLVDFRLNNFDEDCRNLLNTLNMKISDEVPVYSVVATSGKIGDLEIIKPGLKRGVENILWIDFNSLNYSVSLFCGKQTFLPNRKYGYSYNDWILIEIEIDKIRMNEEECAIYVTTKSKIKFVPPSFEQLLRVDVDNFKEMKFQFSEKNLLLIKSSKILDYLNAKNKAVQFLSNSDTVGFNLFHRFKKVLRRQQRKRPKPSIIKNTEKNPSTLKRSYKQINHEETSAKAINISNKNSEVCTNISTFNDDFTRLKSSVEKPSDIKLQHTTPKVNQNTKMSRRDSYQSTLTSTPKCYVKLRNMNKKVEDTEPDNGQYGLSQTNKCKNPDNTDGGPQQKKFRKDGKPLSYNIPVNTEQIVNKSNQPANVNGSVRNDVSENLNSTKTKMIHCGTANVVPFQGTSTSAASELNVNSRLVNLVRPLSKDMQNKLSNEADTNDHTLAQTILEYSRNRGFVGITNKLKDKNVARRYSDEELRTVRQNLTEIHDSVERSTNKFFKTHPSERNVYDLQNIMFTSKPKRKGRSVAQKNIIEPSSSIKPLIVKKTFAPKMLDDKLPDKLAYEKCVNDTLEQSGKFSMLDPLGPSYIEMNLLKNRPMESITGMVRIVSDQIIQPASTSNERMIPSRSVAVTDENLTDTGLQSMEVSVQNNLQSSTITSRQIVNDHNQLNTVHNDNGIIDLDSNVSTTTRTRRCKTNPKRSIRWSDFASDSSISSPVNSIIKKRKPIQKRRRTSTMSKKNPKEDSRKSSKPVLKKAATKKVFNKPATGNNLKTGTVNETSAVNNIQPVNASAEIPQQLTNQGMAAGCSSATLNTILAKQNTCFENSDMSESYSVKRNENENGMNIFHTNAPYFSDDLNPTNGDNLAMNFNIEPMNIDVGEVVDPYVDVYEIINVDVDVDADIDVENDQVSQKTAIYETQKIVVPVDHVESVEMSDEVNQQVSSGNQVNMSLSSKESNMYLLKNQHIDKSWLCLKFLNDVNSVHNLPPEPENDISIEAIRHAPTLLSNASIHTGIQRNDVNENCTMHPEPQLIENVSLTDVNSQIDKASEDSIKESIIQIENQPDEIFLPTLLTNDSDTSDDSSRDDENQSVGPESSMEYLSVSQGQLREKHNVKIVQTCTKTILYSESNNMEYVSKIETSNASFLSSGSENIRDADAQPLASETKNTLEEFKSKIDGFTNEMVQEFQDSCQFKDSPTDFGALSKKLESYTNQKLQSQKKIKILTMELDKERNTCIKAYHGAQEVMTKLIESIEEKYEFYQKNSNERSTKFRTLNKDLVEMGSEIRKQVWTDFMNQCIEELIKSMQPLFELEK